MMQDGTGGVVHEKRMIRIRSNLNDLRVITATLSSELKKKNMRLAMEIFL